MADAPEAATPQLVLTHANFVGDIVAAFRSELAHSLPIFLAPLVKELNHLKEESALILEGCDKFSAAPALANFLSALPSSAQSSVLPAAAYLTGVAAVEGERPSAFPSAVDAAFKNGSQLLPPVAVLGAPLSATAAIAAAGGGKAAGPESMEAQELEAIARALEACEKVSCEDAKARQSLTKTEPAAPEAIHKVTPANSISASGALERCNKVGGEDAMSPEQQPRNEFAESTTCSLPTDVEAQMSRPLVEPAGAPDDGAVPRQGLFGWLCGYQQSQRSLAHTGDYHLTPRYESLEEPATDVEEAEDEEIADPKAAQRLPQEIANLEEKMTSVCENLDQVDALWKNRRRPYEDDIASIRADIEKLEEELELARMPKNEEPPPPGPVALKFVDSEAFNVICNLVVVLNLTAMVLQPRYRSYALMFKVFDQLFLSWYVIELSTKALYYQRALICGKISVVWWNWMDLGIVVSGIVDQWLLPFLMAMNGGHLDIDVSALRMLRILRLFRVMRFLKILKAALKSDFAWTEGATFEWSMAGVIAFNSIIMSVELDIPWAGWVYVENCLQTAYTFELAARLKRQCCVFFTDMDNMVWNYLDFVMVSAGALDLWLVPLMNALQELFFGDSITQSSALSDVLRILKIMRIARVLRLVRLLKMVKPLYRLLIGVIASVKAMQWVMVLTFLMLYACSIVFTNLVGKGLLSDSVVSDLAFQYFGSVPKALFSLFKLMNGDMSVVEPITGSVTGQLLFAGFMVVSNWAILAVLTAVVSENMIRTSQQANEEDDQKRLEMDHQRRIRRLTALFKEIDTDHEGTISASEWEKMMEDGILHRELCNATGLRKGDLNDYFECLAKDPRQEERFQHTTHHMTDLHLDYQTFIEALNNENALADKKSILHVMKYLRILETQVKREFDDLGKHKAV